MWRFFVGLALIYKRRGRQSQRRHALGYLAVQNQRGAAGLGQLNCQSVAQQLGTADLDIRILFKIEVADTVGRFRIQPTHTAATWRVIRGKASTGGL